MPNVYGVTPADVAVELPGLFPGGFTASTRPSDTLVESWITTADTIVGMKVQDITGTAPLLTDKAAVLAKRYIIEWVKAQVYRAAFAGNDIAVVNAAAAPFDSSAKLLLETLTEMGTQIVGVGEPGNRVRVPYEVAERALLVTGEQLDGDEGYRERRF